MNITKEEIRQVLDALEVHLDQTRPMPSTQDAITLLQSKLQEPAHTDHPMRHHDRTCPACQDVEPFAYYDPDAGREVQADFLRIVCAEIDQRGQV